MPYKIDQPPIPFLDPALDPNHPIHHPVDIGENPRLPYTKSQRARLEKEALDAALTAYAPPHVIRSWEVLPELAEDRKKILALKLPPRPKDLVYRGENPRSRTINQPLFDVSEDSGADFRRFAEIKLHVGYWRLHQSTDSSYENSEPPDIVPDDVCWILEYTPTECNSIRRKLAWAMGLYPAVIDEDTSLYNEEVAFGYGHGRRIFARCSRWNKACIRPSHIVISTFSNIIVP